MITTTPVARWTWGREDRSYDKITRCLQFLYLSLASLPKHQLPGDADPEISVSVLQADKPNSYLFQGTLDLSTMTPSSNPVQQLTDQVNATLPPGRIGSVYASAKASLKVTSGDATHIAAGDLLIGSSASLDYVSIDLTTFTDAWMQFDLKGHPQPDVYAANAPRLAATLRSISDTLNCEIDPDEPTYFGKPTETGVDNYFEGDGSASDVWSSFEVPYRHDQFTQTPGFGEIGYKRSVEGEVQYVPVYGKHGVQGYLWASEAGGAASFEPRDVGNDEVYESGLLWLKRLRSAYDRGLSPIEALAELSGPSGLSDRKTLDLASLRELAAAR